MSKYRYREVKNYIHNELKLTKEDIKEIMVPIVKEEVKRIFQNTYGNDVEYYAVDCEGLLFHIYEIQKFMRDENIEPRIMSGNFSNKHLLSDESLNKLLNMSENENYCKTNPNKL